MSASDRLDFRLADDCHVEEFVAGGRRTIEISPRVLTYRRVALHRLLQAGPFLGRDRDGADRSVDGDQVVERLARCPLAGGTRGQENDPIEMRLTHGA